MASGELFEVTYLVADIGGTHSRLELFKITRDADNNIEETSLIYKSYPSWKYDHLRIIVLEFFRDSELINNGWKYPVAACFALAGPIQDGSANVTNLNWKLKESDLSLDLGIDHIVFVNDFVACGYGLFVLPDSDLERITSPDVEIEPRAPKAIIGAGTGLGEAFLTHNGSEYVVYPGEGGHSDFAPRNLDEFKLASRVRKSHNISRIGVERIVSGQGIKNIWDNCVKNEELDSEIQISSSPGKFITYHALKPDYDKFCRTAMEKFVEFFGAEAGNVACRLLPFGGLYIAGGIAPNILSLLKDEKGMFIKNFMSKGRMSDLLKDIPIFVVKNTAIGILGARVVARRRLRDAKIMPELEPLDSKDAKTNHVESEFSKFENKGKKLKSRNNLPHHLSSNDLPAILHAEQQRKQTAHNVSDQFTPSQFTSYYNPQTSYVDNPPTYEQHSFGHSYEAQHQHYPYNYQHYYHPKQQSKQKSQINWIALGVGLSTMMIGVATYYLSNKKENSKEKYSKVKF